jgi:hypothetical protein
MRGLDPRIHQKMNSHIPDTAVILRCSPSSASLEGWQQTLVPVAILRDAAQARGSSG